MNFCLSVCLSAVAQRAEWGPGDKILRGPLPPDLGIAFNGHKS